MTASGDPGIFNDGIPLADDESLIDYYLYTPGSPTLSDRAHAGEMRRELPALEAAYAEYDSTQLLADFDRDELLKAITITPARAPFRAGAADLAQKQRLAI